jgi:thioredoxin-like negative regulator of GroEL
VAVTPEEQGPSADYFGTTEIVMGQVVDWASVTASLPIKAVPTTLLIGADGRVVAAYIGTFTEERVEELLISQD